MRRWVWRTVAGLSLLLGAMTLVGWFLPVAHVASRSRVIAGSRAAIYARLSNVPGYPTWWPEVSRVDTLTPVGDHARYREHLSTGAVIFELVETTAPSRLVSRIADPDQPFGGSWTFDLVPEGAAVRVTITEHGEVYNPLLRFLSRYAFSQTATIDSCLAALASAAQP